MGVGRKHVISTDFECGASVQSEPEGTEAGLGQRENERLLRSEY